MIYLHEVAEAPPPFFLILPTFLANLEKVNLILSS